MNLHLPRPSAIKVILTLALLAGASQACAGDPVGMVTHVSGRLLARAPGGAIKVLAINARVAEGDIISSQTGTYARILFTDKTELTLQPATQLKIEQYAFHEMAQPGDGAVLSMSRGSVRIATGVLGTTDKGSFRLVMPSLSQPDSEIVIDQPGGGTFLVEYVPERPSQLTFAPVLLAFAGAPTLTDVAMSLLGANAYEPIQLAQNTPPKTPGLYVSVIDGAINLSNKGGSQSFTAGQFGYTANITKPPVVVPANPGLKFTPPPTFSSNSGQNSSGGNKAAAVDCVVR